MMHKIIYYPIFLFVFVFSSYAIAGINVPWSTTYNCADWNKYSDPLNCDNIAKSGSWTANPEGYSEQITAAANYPGGAGGKGQRHWVGDGTNNNSGGTRVNFNTPQGKFWIRWYMRWEAGFGMFGQFKAIYGYGTSGTNGPLINFFYPGDGMSFEYLSSGNETCNACGFGTDFYTGGVSDGSWVYVEAMIDAAGGNLKLWVGPQQRLVIDRSGVQFKESAVSYFQIGENQKYVANGRSMYVDYDDFAISTTGYIGPIGGGGGGGGGGGDTTAPSVSVTSPAQGATVAGSINLTASSSDDVGVAGVQFKVDGANYSSEDSSAPYSVSLDTQALADGSHTIAATSRDAAGNQTTSSQITVTVSNSASTPPPSTTLLTETFEDSNFSSRGWYDNTNLTLTTSEHISGSTKSVEFLFNQGATTPTSGNAIRYQFSDTDSVYLSYYVKYSSNWVGSTKNYHPHEFFFMTNLESAYAGMATTNLTVYVEQNSLRPLFNIQDSLNIDSNNVGNNLVGVSENRAVGGCNGDSDGYGDGDCYQYGVWRNDKHWLYNSAVISANTWHKVEAYLKLNSVVGGIGQQDGVMQYWLNGNLLMDYHDVVFRTGQHPTMKFNQMAIGPYIGDGSPVTQTMWLDNLTLATSPPGQSTTNVSTPSGFIIVNP